MILYNKLCVPLCLLCATLCNNKVNSQEARLTETIESIAEQLAADESDPEAAAIYTEKLSELAEDPVNLNSSDEDELSRLFFLTNFQIRALADYSRSSGKILSIFEIAAIPGFDRQTAEMMAPFVSFNQIQKPDQKSVPFRNTLLTTMIFKPGTADTNFTGSPLKFLGKYRFTSGSFSGNLTIEKDAGEKFFSGKPSLPDFISSSLSYNGKGFVKRIIIGDFSARFGQGTNINTGISTGLSLTAPGYMAARSETRPYTSSDENNFFRGLAAEFTTGKMALSVFYSKNSIDASLDEERNHFTNFYTSGLHNTPSLMLKKDAIANLAFGSNLSYNLKNTRIGFIWSQDRFSLPLAKEGTDPENTFSFQGDRNSLYSLYYNSLISKALLYGEISIDKSAGKAIIQGASLRLSDRLTVNGLFRSYEPGFFSHHGRGPGSGTGWNETSMLGNFIFEAAKHLFLSAGCDLRNYPWLRYRSSAPSRSLREEVRLRYLPSDKLTLEAVYNFSLTMSDDSESPFIPVPQEIRTNYLKASVRFSPAENLNLTTRLDYKFVQPSGSKGMLLLQDFSYRFRKIPLTFWYRYCIFHTADWNSRIYTYENDLIHSFSIPALSGRGSRSYFMIKYELRDIEVRFKYGITSVSGEEGIGNKEEIRFQARIFF